MAKIYFITGAEGVGKTSKLNGLRKRFLNIEIHDFDDVGVPENPTLKWRLDTTKHWIKIAINNLKKGKSTIIIGLSFPSEVKRYCPKGVEIKFCLLDINETERTKRLKERDSSEDMINDYGCLYELKREFKEIKGKIINTSNKTNEENLKRLVNWISELEG